MLKELRCALLDVCHEIDGSQLTGHAGVGFRILFVDQRTRLAAASRDGLLALRRVERQQVLIERLCSAHGHSIQLGELAADFRVSIRTIARDVERLQDSGVPLEVRRGRAGGVRMAPLKTLQPIVFDLPEVAALLSSLAVLGPSVSESASSATRKLVRALERLSTEHL